MQNYRDMAQIPLKGSTISPILINHFKTFEEFYEYADPIYKGAKKEFETLYYTVHQRPLKQGGGGK